jgi:hypothetical protein
LVFLFGVFMVVFIGLYAILLATLPSVVASYVFAFRKLLHESVFRRILTQFGALMLAMCVFTALAVGLMCLTVQGNAGSGVRFFGAEMGELRPFAIWAGLSVPAVLVGEFMLAVRRRRGVSPPSSDAPSRALGPAPSGTPSPADSRRAEHYLVYVLLGLTLLIVLGFAIYSVWFMYSYPKFVPFVLGAAVCVLMLGVLFLTTFKMKATESVEAPATWDAAKLVTHALYLLVPVSARESLETLSADAQAPTAFRALDALGAAARKRVRAVRAESWVDRGAEAERAGVIADALRLRQERIRPPDYRGQTEPSPANPEEKRWAVLCIVVTVEDGALLTATDTDHALESLEVLVPIEPQRTRVFSCSWLPAHAGDGFDDADLRAAFPEFDGAEWSAPRPRSAPPE